jgi:hypothetical protein
MGIPMDEQRKGAYRFLLSAAMCDIKIQLSCLYRVSWLPWRALRQIRSAKRAFRLSIAFHNLADFATREFVGFSEEKFWTDIDWLEAGNGWSYHDYRDLFHRFLEGEQLFVSAPNGGPKAPTVDGRIARI